MIAMLLISRSVSAAPTPVHIAGRALTPNVQCHPSAPVCTTSQQARLDMIGRINCPVMGALVKQGDLRPDCYGRVSKKQVKDAMLCTGISPNVVQKSSDSNFNHLCPRKSEVGRSNYANAKHDCTGVDETTLVLNLYEMSTVTESQVGGGNEAEERNAVEHFRSTGFRDRGDKDLGGDIEIAPKSLGYETRFEASTSATEWTLQTVLDATALYDTDTPTSLEGLVNEQVYIDSMGGTKSSDTNGMFRPQYCGADDSLSPTTIVENGVARPNMAHPCFSNYYGSISFMFQEFGTPVGLQAKMSKLELKALFLDSDYPTQFTERMPKNCGGTWPTTEFGCQSCYDDMMSTLSTDAFAKKQDIFCTCMRSADFLASEPHINFAAGDTFTPFSDNSVLKGVTDVNSAYTQNCEVNSPMASDGAYGSVGSATVPPSNVYISGTPAYPYWTRGEYTTADFLFNGSPVYQKQGGIYTWSLYRRQNGYWYLDFDTIDESWSGTVNYALAPSETPFEASWNSNMAIGYPTLDVTGEPHYAGRRGSPNYQSRGSYTINPTETHAGAPVYERPTYWTSLTWKLYRRDNGKWYLTFNYVGNTWDGTIHYAHDATASPLWATWSAMTSDAASMHVRLPPKSQPVVRRALSPQLNISAHSRQLEVPSPSPLPTTASTVDEVAEAPQNWDEVLHAVPNEDEGDAALEEIASADHAIEPHTVPEA